MEEAAKKCFVGGWPYQNSPILSPVEHRSLVPKMESYSQQISHVHQGKERVV